MRRTAETWARLSPNYRKRLERNGITKQRYLSGANLQSARGQTIEARRTQERLAVARTHRLPAASTLRSWKARALRRGVTPDDWQAALDAAGPGRFASVRAAVQAMEQRHREWTRAGEPRRSRFIDTEREETRRPIVPSVPIPPSEYYYDEGTDNYWPVSELETGEEYDAYEFIEYEPEPELEWGESWGFYH